MIGQKEGQVNGLVPVLREIYLVSQSISQVDDTSERVGEERHKNHTHTHTLLEQLQQDLGGEQERGMSITTTATTTTTIYTSPE